MSKIKLLKKFNPYLIFVILIIFCVHQYGLQKICGFTLYPDEFGYWASAADAVGYDWSEVASMGSYYSFGYSLILIPLLKFFHGGVTAYHTAITINMICMSMGMLLICKLMKAIFPNISDVKNILISGIAVMYPPWIFYMQMTLAESLLMLLFIVITYLLVRLAQKPGIITAVLLAIMFVYSYSVHMRMAGVVLAAMFVLILWGLNHSTAGKHMLVLLAVLVLSGAIFLLIQRSVILNVFTYADEESLAVNSYGSQMWKIRDILSLRGSINFAGEMLGKIYYLGLSSFGLFYWTFMWSIKETIHLITNTVKRKKCYASGYLAAFLILSVLAEVLISSIFMHGSVSIDSVIYGRYTEFMLPVMIAIGIACIYRSKQPFRGILLIAVLSGIITPIIILYIKANHMEGIKEYFVSGISYVMRENSFDVKVSLWQSWLIGSVLMLVITELIYMSKRIKNVPWLLGGILTMEILLGFRICTYNTYRVNEIIYPDLAIAEQIMEEINEQDEVVYLDEGIAQYIDFQQMQMPELSIHVIKETELPAEDTPGRFLIVYHDSKYQEQFDKSYDRKLISPSFILYYNEA